MRAWLIVAALAIAACRAKAPAAVPPPPAPTAAATPASARDVSNRIVPAAPAVGRGEVSAGPATAAAPVLLADAGNESDDAEASDNAGALSCVPHLWSVDREVTSAVEACEKAASAPGKAEAAASLLALGRVYAELRPALCGDAPNLCDRFVSFTLNRAEFDEDGYDGRQLRAIVERFPKAPEAVESRCLLTRLEAFRGGHGQDAAAWGSPECRAFLVVAGPKGPCPSELSEDGDLVELARACERTALAASDAEAARLLTATARLYRLLEERCRNGAVGCAGMDELMRDRTDLFRNGDIVGWFYTGTLYAEVIHRWPDSAFADDAAYEVTLLSIGGECEGFLDCEVEHAYRQVSRFLTQRPRSRHVPAAVARLNGWLGDTRRRWAPALALGGSDPKRTLRAYEKAAAAFDPKPRREALGEIVAWWKTLGDEAEAARVGRLAADAPKTP